MTNGTENLGNGAVTDERFGAHLGYRGVARRDTLSAVPEHADADLRSNGSVLDSLTEPVLSASGWTRSEAPLAEHPLLHGLLLELPPKQATPDPAWLDRWFEAARSILELIYSQPDPAPAAHR
jgi:hypothetical protein